jgi:hypothetical protein
MASALKYSAVLKNAQMDAITTKVGASCLIDIYSGTQATNPDTAIGAQVKLATLTGNATFAPASSGGVLTLNSISSGTGTAGAGAGTTATWFRMSNTTGPTAHVDGTVGISGCDLNINNTSIATGQTVSATSWTFTNAN